MGKVTLPLLKLRELEARIQARSDAMRADHAFWPCAREPGCDHCCRTLPRLPVVTKTEWENLSAAIDTLGAIERDLVRQRIRTIGTQAPLTCPLLDERGACSVYEARPIGCRTYGFYTERDAGLHCEKVTAAIEREGMKNAIVWGNGEAVAHDLAPLGEAKSLDAWLREDDGGRQLCRED